MSGTSLNYCNGIAIFGYYELWLSAKIGFNIQYIQHLQAKNYIVACVFTQTNLFRHFWGIFFNLQSSFLVQQNRMAQQNEESYRCSALGQKLSRLDRKMNTFESFQTQWGPHIGKTECSRLGSQKNHFADTQAPFQQSQLLQQKLQVSSSLLPPCNKVVIW